MPEIYRCDECGACCRQHTVHADAVDVLRAPEIAERGEALRHGAGAFLIAVAGDRCRFLQPDNRCEIYDRRPRECVAYPAGSSKCQDARAAEGLLPLVPVQVQHPTAVEWLQIVAAKGRT